MTETRRPDNESLGPKIRKAVAIGAGILAVVGGIKLATNEKIQEAFMVEADPEAATAVKVRDLFAKIEASKETLATLEGENKLGKTDVLTNPGAVISTLESANQSVLAINSTLEEIKGTGFKVNSLIAYGQVREVDQSIAKLRGGGFLAEQLKEHGGVIGNIHIPGTNITLSPQQSSQALREKDKLVKNLTNMKDLLGEISDLEIEDFSNNKYVNEKNRFESPKRRLGFIQNYLFKVLENDMEKNIARKEGREKEVVGVGGDDLQFYMAFLEQYGFVSNYPAEGDWENDENYRMQMVNLANQGKESYKAMMRVALRARHTYAEQDKKTNSPQIRKLQELLARGGYFDYRNFDTTYGDETHMAFSAYLEDTSPENLDGLVGYKK